MRIGVALVLSMFLVPLAVSSEGEARDALAVGIYHVDGVGAIISWSPAPGATGYEVYRGPTLDDLTLIGSTETTIFFDPDSPAGDVWYMILSTHPATIPVLNGGIGTYKGACVDHHGMTGISVSAANCLPTRPI